MKYFARIALSLTASALVVAALAAPASARRHRGPNVPGVRVNVPGGIDVNVPGTPNVPGVNVNVPGVPKSKTRPHAHKAPKNQKTQKTTSGVTSVAIGDQAALSSDGKTANVVLTVTCSDVKPAPIRVTLRQNGVTGSATSGTNYMCNGNSQNVVVPVTAASGTFHKGDASASESVSFHSSTQTNSTSSSNSTRTIQLV